MIKGKSEQQSDRYYPLFEPLWPTFGKTAAIPLQAPSPWG